MKLSNLAAALLFAVVAMLQVSCSGTEERDGRQYHGNASPLQGKMGVTFKRVRSSIPPVTTNVDTATAAPESAAAAPPPPPAAESDGLLGKFIPKIDGPPGLLDLRSKPDEPGAEYWMHGQQSPNPIQGKMGVRVSRRKK